MDSLLARLAFRLVETSRRFAVPVVALSLCLAGALGVVTATRLGMDTDLSKLLSADEPWRQQDLAFLKAFPQFRDLLVAVVDGDTADGADDAAAALVARLAPRTDLFSWINRPESDPFFRREGLLFLSVPELSATLTRTIEAQAFIGSLAADPSLRGLFGTLSLALEGVARGAATFDRLERPLTAIADTIAGTLAGGHRPLSWQGLLTGQAPRPEELRRFVLLQVVRDFDQLTSGDSGIAAVRQAIHELGLNSSLGVRVRLTGSVAIENEELETLVSGAGVSLALSLGLVSLVLFLALRSWRLILPIVITLLVGLVMTAGFATLAVGTLNPISVAFAVLFIGLAVDFSIQFTVRYREERFRCSEPVVALSHTASGISGALFLAAVTTALGFLSFLPTAYVGVSQLGLIAGVGMLIAVSLNFTLLPALLTLFRPLGEPASVGFTWAAPIDHFLITRRRTVLAVALLVALIGIALTPMLRFDSNPMNLRDPATESIATALDLMKTPDTTPFTADILAPSPAEAARLVAGLEAHPEVFRALAITSFVPEAQEDKLALIEDAALLLGPTLSPPTLAPPPTALAIRDTIALTAQHLHTLSAPLSAPPTAPPTARRLADLLDRIMAGDDALLASVSNTLLSGLPARLDALRQALTAQPVTLATLPQSLTRDWLTAEGQARLLVFPAGQVSDSIGLERFVQAVRAVAPMATGSAVNTRESAFTIIRAFLEAGIISLVTIAILLWLVLRRLTDVLLVLAPLLLSALMTVITCVVVGPALNFANVIALPLILGIGVAFNIYFVMNWRAGLTGPLQSSTARAVVFSALTTVVAFGSLALSNHPGTASMGILLTISLGFTLVNSLITLPALLGKSSHDPVAPWSPSATNAPEDSEQTGAIS